MGAHYGTNEVWKLEPSVAEKVFREMIAEEKIPVYFGQQLTGSTARGLRFTELRMTSGKFFHAKIFIDATYEGDLMERANFSSHSLFSTNVVWHVGRESNSLYHETLNGICARTPKHQFLVAVDPYKTPGDPKSGLLSLIQTNDFGRAGDGDRCMQAYNFRLCLTQNPTNKIPIASPPDYDAKKFELLARYLEALAAAGKKTKLGDLMHIQPMPNGKTDINNNGAFSTDFIGENYDYPNTDFETRAKIFKEHENYTRGFLHFLATSPRVPKNIRDEMQSWGLCKDEFQGTGGWPHQLYVREARRMISDYVMTEHNCRGEEVAPDSIGLAAYQMDSHNCRRIVRNGRVENEGDVQVAPMKPYPISFRAIVPKKTACENLVVPVCLSATHIAYGSIRMEPVFMVLGQSAATAASLAIDENCPLQKLNYEKLRNRLLADGQVLEWAAAKPNGNSR